MDALEKHMDALEKHMDASGKMKASAAAAIAETAD